MLGRCLGQVLSLPMLGHEKLQRGPATAALHPSAAAAVEAHDQHLAGGHGDAMVVHNKSVILKPVALSGWP